MGLLSSTSEDPSSSSSSPLTVHAYNVHAGRRRLGLKRDFIYSLRRAKELCSIKQLNPGHVEELADQVDTYLRDFSVDMSTHVLSVLRGVLYLFNGDESECVTVVGDDGFIEKKFIRASSASWTGIKLILRRKGRFLRYALNDGIH